MINGKNAARGQYPTFTSIVLADDVLCETALFAKGSMHGGGNLIAPNKILTAAHVVHDDCHGYPFALTPDNLGVIVGAYELSNQKAQGEIRKVKAIHIHPEFNAYSLDYDYAVLELEEDVGIAPSSLLLDNKAIDELATYGAMMQITGMGYISSGFALPDVLQIAEVPIYSTSAMRPFMYPYIVNPETMLVGGDPEKMIDAAQRDSGSPCFIVDDEGLKQIALVSWGAKSRQYCGVYARVDAARDWLATL